MRTCTAKVFHWVKQRPWNLTQGDIERNVDGLSDYEGPNACELTKKIHTLKRFGMDAQLKVALEVLREAPLSIACLEQGHACAAIIMRKHPRLAENSLSSRALLGAFRK